MNKEELRKKIKALRKTLSFDSNLLADKLMQTKEYKQAKNIMLFYPLKNEVNLLSVVRDKTKKFFLPKIDGENLLCCPYGEEDELCVSCFKTMEPVSQACDKSLIDLVIVPALCCEKKKKKLGYGGGFYDRFLKNFRAIKAVCLPKELIVETVFPELHDVPVDIIITD